MYHGPCAKQGFSRNQQRFLVVRSSVARINYHKRPRNNTMKIHGSNSVAATGARVALRSFGQELRNARAAAGLRQEDVAGELGVSTQTVRNWESGRVEPSEENKQRLGERYGEQVGDFAAFYEELHSHRLTRKRPVINAKLLRLARQDAGFTQAQAAERLGVNRNTVVRYENATSRPSPKILSKLSEIYRKNPRWFLDGGSASHSAVEDGHAGPHDTTTPAGRARFALELAISGAPDKVINDIAGHIGAVRTLNATAKRGPIDRDPGGEWP